MPVCPLQLLLRCDVRLCHFNTHGEVFSSSVWGVSDAALCWQVSVSGVTVVQLSDGQTVQLQGVIQAPQTSVIQSPQVQVRSQAHLSPLITGWSVCETEYQHQSRASQSRRPLTGRCSSNSHNQPRVIQDNSHCCVSERRASC